MMLPPCRRVAVLTLLWVDRQVGRFAFKWTFSKARGAILITQGTTRVEDATREGLFRAYIKQHRKAWVAFAKAKGLQVGMEDLILVTGHETARAWAMAVARGTHERTGGVAFEGKLQSE